VADIDFQVKFGSRIYDNPEAGLDAFVNELKRTWAGEAAVISVALKGYLNKVAEAVAERNSGAETTSTSLAKRTGQSMQSVLRSVKISGATWDKLSGSVGGSEQLAIHEFGGIMRARKGKYLTIPLPAAKARTGNAPPFARQWRNTFVAMSKNGNLLIFQRRASGIVPLYVLKPSVRIRPRLGMRAELEKQAPYFLAQAADLVVRDVERQLGGS
jgi:hypothetical protein